MAKVFRLILNRSWLAPLVILAVLALTLSCAPGNERWASVDNKAGFWAGLWHGLIIVVTFIVSLFTKDVGIYESNNVGVGYNIGFLLGCLMSLGGGIRSAARRRHRVKVKLDPSDWERLGKRVERCIRDGIEATYGAAGTVHTAYGSSSETRNGTQATGASESDWEELGRRIGERIKEELKDWED